MSAADDRSGDVLATGLQRAPVRTYDLTALPDLGDLVHLREGEPSVIAAFPKHGKTALAEMLALDLSIEHGVLFLPLEMGVHSTLLNLSAKLAKCSVNAIERHGLDAVTRGELNARKLKIRAPEPGRKWNLREIERLIVKCRAPIVILDHVRWIDGWLEGGMVPTKMAEEIQRIAHRTGAHIIQCCQLKIEDYGKRPSLWRLQDTAALTQLASVEIVINRPYFGQSVNRDRVAELIVRANRWGPPGKIHARWVGATKSFWHLEESDFENIECTCKERRTKARSA